MDYLSVLEMSKLWEITPQQIRTLCREGRVSGAIQTKDGWMIPKDEQKPGRKVRKKAARGPNVPKNTLTPLAKRIVYQKSKNNHYGFYEYIQVNLTYSSNRMASNRLTRTEVEEIYRTNKITSSFEPAKVDDIIETINHIAAVRCIVDNIQAPITQGLVQKLHKLLTYGTYAERKERYAPGSYRIKSVKKGTAPNKINTELGSLIREYEAKAVDLDCILDFHVRFLNIRPFDDYNGRVGRLIMMKECLRFGIDPFIIDDKRRSAYHKGLVNWEKDPTMLQDVVKQAQERFQRYKQVCKLMEYCRPATGRGAR